MTWLASIDLWSLGVTVSYLVLGVLLIGYAFKEIRERWLMQTLGRLVKALLGGLTVAAALFGLYIGIDRLVVDLHGLKWQLTFAVVTAVASFWTFHRLDRAPSPQQ